GVLLVMAVIGLAAGDVLLSRANSRTAEQRRRAEATARTLERQLYIHRINLAQRECLDDHVSPPDRLLPPAPPHRRGWEWSSLKRLGHPGPGPLLGHAQWVNAGAYSPDGARIVSGAGKPYSYPSRDDVAELIVWDAATGREVRRVAGLRGS